MSMADEFWQYAEEALRGAERSETSEEKQALIGLARTWTEAAVQRCPARGMTCCASSPLPAARALPPST